MSRCLEDIGHEIEFGAAMFCGMPCGCRRVLGDRGLQLAQRDRNGQRESEQFRARRVTCHRVV